MYEYTNKFRKMNIILGISPKNLDVLLKYLGDLKSYLCNKVILFNPKRVDEASVQEQYMKNICHKKGKPSGSKQKEHQDASKEGNKKWKGKDKTTTTTHWSKDPSNHCNHFNIDGYTEEKCWKLHSKINPKNCKKEVNLSIVHHGEEKEMKKLLHINI
jgi:hypothetical protein